MTEHSENQPSQDPNQPKNVAKKRPFGKPEIRKYGQIDQIRAYSPEDM